MIQGELKSITRQALLCGGVGDERIDNEESSQRMEALRKSIGTFCGSCMIHRDRLSTAERNTLKLVVATLRQSELIENSIAVQRALAEVIEFL